MTVGELQASEAVLGNIGHGMRLFIAFDASGARLIDGFRQGRADIPVTLRIAQHLVASGQVCSVSRDGDFVDGKRVRAGWFEWDMPGDRGAIYSL